MSWFDKACTRLSIVGTLGLLVAVAGCAEERAPINRVQPNALDKSFFVGKDLLNPSDDPEFYSQATIIDVGYGADQDGLFTSTYAQPVTRIKWTVQEDYLIGRLTYERIAGTDGKGVGAGPLRGDGVIAAKFKIDKHFDIQRAYNSTTGEELNVIEENSSDRPWYERQYMRVDWSANLNTDSYDFDMLSLLGVIGGIKYESGTYYVNDPNDPNAPMFSTKDGYFDVTTKAFAVPQMIDLSRLGWGIDQYPACFLPAAIGGGSAPTANCNPVELTIRHAFRQVVDTDYEPADWDGQKFQAFGAFDTERTGYARLYGMTDDLQHRFINRYNIWKRSHFYKDPEAMKGAVECYTPFTTTAGDNPERDDDGNGTADECESVGRGSQCDTFSQKCTLPYRDREVRTQAWYYASGSNQEYFDSTAKAAHEWDVALRTAVMSARYAECVATAEDEIDAEGCAELYPMYAGQQEENEDAINLSVEVEACRMGLAYPEFKGRCDLVADEVGGTRGYSDGVITIAKMEPMIVLCHSPVESGDHPACGGPRLPPSLTAAKCDEAFDKGQSDVVAKCNQALTVRRGDLRYHQVNVIKAPQTPSPWGIMVDSHDPLTGEKIAASVNVWSHVTDLASQQLVDLARYAKGELSTEDVTNGQNVSDWSQVAAAAARGGSFAPMTAAEVDSKIAAVANLSDAKFREAMDMRLPRSVEDRIAEYANSLSNVMTDYRTSTSSKKPIYETRRAKALGSTLEAELTTPAMQQLVGGMSKVMPELASPLRGANPATTRDLRQLRDIALAERGACMIGDVNEAPAPVSIANIADHLERKFGKFDGFESKAKQLERAEKMRKYVAFRYNYAVIAHEMGHSIGLRHNFVSSSDAWGFRPQYWQLRTQDGSRSVACESANTPAGCIGPRYFDPISQEQADQLLPMFMHSTVMDYPGELTQDMIGLGAYDFAAARFFYGNTVAVFQDPNYKAGTPRGTGMLNKEDNFGGIVGIKPSIGREGGAVNQTTNFHYSQLQNVYKLIQDCRPINADAFKPAVWDEDRFGTWDPLFDGLLVQVAGSHTRCRTQPVDYVRWDKLRMPTTSEIRFYNRGGPAVDPNNRVRVPYGFGTDSWADTGNLSVFRHDNGADAYELFDFLITQQEMNHIFDNYRRNRFTFSVRGAVNRTLGRYNEKLRDAAKGLGLMVNVYRNMGVQEGIQPDKLFAAVVKSNHWEDNVLAAQIAFNHFARQLQRPQSGTNAEIQYGAEIDPVLRFNDSAGLMTKKIVIPTGATGKFGNVGYGGKLLENSFASDRGEYNTRYEMNAGSYYEKAYTSMLMTESVDNFVSSDRDDFLDARFRSISLADLFPDGYRRWLANNLTGDDEIRGPRIATDDTGKPLADAQGFPLNGIGWTDWTGVNGPTACFQESMSLNCTTTPPANTRPVDPQIGWEQQKFLIAWTLQYLPENQKQTWLSQLRLWELGADSDPVFQNRIEFHDPLGRVYVAKTFGKETIFGKTVQKAPAARVLEWANYLLQKAYVVNGVDNDGDGAYDWYVPVLGTDGLPQVKFDPTMTYYNDALTDFAPPPPGCSSETDQAECVCASNRACMALEDYSQVPFFLRQALATYEFIDVGMKGQY